VFPHPQGHAQVGYYPIRPTEAGRTIAADWPDHVYQWHREGFDLPAGGELLAEGDDAFSVQAFRSGTGYALQFHPEVTHAMMYRWLVRGAHRMELPGTKQRHEHIADRAVHDHAARNWLAAFIDHWIGRKVAAE
jgi:GMP synthase (glutamine-hydrolysing)